MARSDISDETLDGDTATSVELRYGGRRYRLDVTQEEAEGLAGKGKERRGFVAWLRHQASRGWVKFLAGSLVGALIAGFVGQNVADYYSDKQQRRELESDLLKTMNLGTTALFAETQQVATAQQSAKQVERYRQMLGAWQGVSADVRSVLAAYYAGQSGTEAAKAWTAFHDAFYQYGRLACCETGLEPRREAVEKIRTAAEPYNISAMNSMDEEEWAVVTAGPDRTGFQLEYRQLGFRLLRVLPAVGETITSAEPNLD